MLSVVSDHYYMSYFVIPMVLLIYYSWMEDDNEINIVRFPSYFSYFCWKWLGAGVTAILILIIQTAVVLLSGIGLPGGNNWLLPEGAVTAELFSALALYFTSPASAFVAYTIFQMAGTWFLAGICMWISHFAGGRWTVRILMLLYVLAVFWIKVPVLQEIPFTGINHLLILHHSLNGRRMVITAVCVVLLTIIILFMARKLWRTRFLQIPISLRGLVPYYMRKLLSKRNVVILGCIITVILLYKGLTHPNERTAEEWVFLLFSGHGTGYLHLLSFLEMLIVNGAPLYLLAVFMEVTVSGQSLFVSARAVGRRNILFSLWTASGLFLLLYCALWLTGAFIGIQFLGYLTTADTWKYLFLSIGLKFCDLLFQYMVMLTVYICTKQTTAGFLALIGGNFLCVLPIPIAAYSPFGLSSMVRLGFMEAAPGSAFLIALTIQILFIGALGLWNCKFGYKSLFN